MTATYIALAISVVPVFLVTFGIIVGALVGWVDVAHGDSDDSLTNDTIGLTLAAFPAVGLCVWLVAMLVHVA